MSLPLQTSATIAPAVCAPRQAAAWFLRGASADAWLDEILRWGIAADESRLLVLPVSVSSREPAGVLVVPPAGESPRVRPEGVPYSLVKPALWLPCDAEVAPPLSADELRRRCGEDTLVWHPVHGLVLFSREDELRLWQLLSLPLRIRGEEWNAAVPVEPVNRRIESITLFNLWSPDNLFGGAEEEIGTEPPKDLPDWKDERKRGLAGRMLDRLSGKGKTPPAQPGAGKGAGAGRGWLGRMSDALEKRRWKAVDKLLSDLKSDPEKALRRAIPFVRNPHRGLAPSGAELPDRAVEFSLSQLGRSGPADQWNLPLDYQLQLRTLYQELALREKSLGRHRRAAFIYSNLLGDLLSSAGALKEGGFHREAAIIYKTFLHNPAGAARCLQEGKLYQDAATLFEELKMWKEAAECYEALGLRHRAAACWRLTVESATEAGDYVLAAGYLEHKLDEPREALAMLRRTWPDTPQAMLGLTAEFDLCARHSWHGEAHARAESLRALTSGQPQHQEPLARLLTALARAYPDNAARRAAHEAALVRLAALLSGEATDLAAQAALILPALAPGDRLLPRDASRHLAAVRRRAAAEAAKRKALARPEKEVTELEVEWLERRQLAASKFPLGRVLAAASSGNHWYVLAVSQKGGDVVLLRGSWMNSHVQHGIYWNCQGAGKDDFTLFLGPQVVPGPMGMIVVTDRLNTIRGVQPFPSDDSVRERQSAGCPDWLFEPAESRRVAADRTCWWTVVDSSGPGYPHTLTCHDPSGKMIGSFAVRAEPEHFSPVNAIALHADRVMIAAGSRLVVMRGGRETNSPLPCPFARQLAVNLPGARPLLAVAGPAGVWLVRPDKPDEVHEADRDLVEAAVCFTHKGHLVAIGENGGVAAALGDRRFKSFCRFDWKYGSPAAVLPAANRTHFAVITRDGLLHIARIRGDGL